MKYDLYIYSTKHVFHLTCPSFSIHNLTPEELADIPTYNLAETVHNKWLQSSGNRGSDLFVATTDDWARAFMHMTNYRSYLCGGASGKGPSKQHLKLKRALQSQDGKKIADALAEMPRGQDFCNRVPYLEGEEVFGSTKRKLDMPIGSERDPHRPDKVNFSHPRVQTRSAATRMIAIDARTPEALVPFTSSVLEIDCDVTKWHIALINHKSKRRCHAVQANNNSKCQMLIVRGGKATTAPTYRGVKQKWRAEGTDTEDFWFCPDQIARCKMGPKRGFVLTRPELRDVWLVLTGTDLSRHEILEL
jgi:hypothetical protein